MSVDIYHFLKDSEHYISIRLDLNLNIIECNNCFRKNILFDKNKTSLDSYFYLENKQKIELQNSEVFLYSKDDKNRYFKCKFYQDDYILLVGEMFYQDELSVVEQMSKINSKLASTTRELHKKNSLLQQTYEDLVEKEKIVISQSRSAAMNELLLMLAHQWRQPLNNISMNTFLINDKLEKSLCKIPDIKKHTQNIINTSDKLSTTIDIFTSKLGQEQKQTTTVDTIVKDVYQLVHQIFENKNIDIKYIYKSTEKITIIPSILIQISLIIIQNSLEAFEKIEKKDKIFEINSYEDKEYLYITLSDNAGGIDDEILLKVFEPYFSTKDEKNDVGLGLYIANLLCSKILGGSIEIKNKDGGIVNTVKISKKLG